MNRHTNPLLRAWQVWTENLDFVAILVLMLVLGVMKSEFLPRWPVSGALWSEAQNSIQFCRDSASHGQSDLKVIHH